MNPDYTFSTEIDQGGEIGAPPFEEDRIEASQHFLANHLIEMYAKCGDHSGAPEVFAQMRVRNVYSWNNMLSGTRSWGWRWRMCRLRALGLLKQLHCQAFVLGFLLNAVISSSIMDANAKCGEMGDRRSLFDEMKWRDVLAWTILLSGNAKNGDMKSAGEIFYSIPKKNSISWTTLISGYAQNGMLFKEMIKSSIEPDQYTYSSCLPNAVVVSSLIDMYSKCGSLDIAKTVFDGTHNENHVVLWNTLMSALAHHGCGLMQEGLALFGSMKADYEIVPDQEHYACLIDLLGQSGCFDDMMNQLKNMPFKPED
ncbi:hypothetical protein SASPL_118112 [Salvia splendens]|uniref:Pentatricopeptide repeat-containing protein n=1 Tax=Salvia splendens TaxID=180675 RepID=A0A8X8ZYU4_SALSN|nr:hypothetical protein SASPL_118112 [Salvia splendens]